MPNGPDRAEFWRSFIIGRCDYPAPDRLGRQLQVAEFHSFCPCGCNTFDVRLPPGSDVPALTSSGKRGAIFEADFPCSTGDQLEIILFSDEHGHLSCIEVDLNSNSAPVPDDIRIVGAACFTHASASLLPD